VVNCQKGGNTHKYDKPCNETLKNWLIINELFAENYLPDNGVFFVFSLA
jgi:hypothetical protein